MNYRFAYSVGFHPWEDAERHKPFVEKITNIFEREETGKTVPFGKALDIGCGNGVWGIHLAKRGWDVTGVDIVDKALKRAKERVEKEKVNVRLIKDDVCELTKIGNDFDLLLDTGTFHGLSPVQKISMGRSINKIASYKAVLLLLVWDPKWRGPLPGGASRKEIETCFPDWKITDIEIAATEPEAIYKILKANEQWYRLVRK